MSFFGFLLFVYVAGVLRVYSKEISVAVPQRGAVVRSLKWPVAFYHWAKAKLNEFRDR